ncbi:ribonucleoside-diphosphate reductase small chain-like [Plutella xylostella]|uniref:ribonucleoside-diphosphate reductase small chain-like n=1 Tax=Plutella xylostella TaxID=51655 RepID=UPI00203224C6|nr:ribonucleoside-diphosphate reductase small chain-like [Plutella xylostella]
MQLQHWNPGELDFARDVDDFKHLPQPLRDLVVKLLAFFAFGDGVVDEVIESVKSKIRIPEVRAFYPAQEESEIVHGQTYGDMLEAFVSPQERDHLLRNIGSIANLDQKLAWVARWTNPRLPLPVLVAAMLLIEQVWFSTAFNIINWFRVINSLPEMVKANEFIIRNENLHGDYAAYLMRRYFNYTENGPLQELVELMIGEAREAELAFIREVTRPLADLEGNCMYAGVQFPVLYDHLGKTIGTVRVQLNGDRGGGGGGIGSGLNLSLLTALGVGKDNFFEYRAPN